MYADVIRRHVKREEDRAERRPMACHAPLIKDAWAIIDYPANSNDIFPLSKEGVDYRTTRDERNAG